MTTLKKMMRGVFLLSGEMATDRSGIFLMRVGRFLLLQFFAVLWFSFFFASASYSQQRPTPEQIRALQAVDPEMARRLLRQTRVPGAAQQQLQADDELDEIDEELADDEELDELEQRIAANSSIVIEFLMREELVDAFNPLAEQNRLDIEADPLLNALLGRHAYELTDKGILNLRGFGPIYLAGLTAEEAAIRVAAEDQLQKLQVTVTILPLEPRGWAALKPFGHELFEDVPSTFAPGADLPIPADYVLGPGDNVLVSLFGNVNAEYLLIVNRDGEIQIPELGPIIVAGMDFSDMKAEVREYVARKMIGTQVNLTMGELRSIQVYVLGDVVQPGSYIVSGLSAIANAVFASGGISDIGSMRRIQHKRNGRVIRNFDLYDALLTGNTKKGLPLEPGDVIFVPSVGPRVAIDGAVLRPAIYELNGESRVGEIVGLAGGFLPDADASAVKIYRINADLERIVVDLNLKSSRDLQQHILPGDQIEIPSVIAGDTKSISLTGHVKRSGDYPWFDGIRVTHLFPDIDVLRPQADMNYVLIKRQPSPEQLVSVLSVDLKAAMRRPGTAADKELMPRDVVTVFDLKSGRGRLIDPILKEIELQASRSNPVQAVQVGGVVRVPGRYPLEPGMRVADLLRAGGGLSESAYAIQAELIRYSVQDAKIQIAELIPIDLAGVLNSVPESNLLLQSYDYLTIKQITDWGGQAEVTLDGQFMFPGKYQIRKGESLRSVIERAGGLTDRAFLQGAVFTRENLRTREQEQLDQLARRLEFEVTTAAMLRVQDSPGAGEAVALGQSLIEQLRSAKALGRLVIDLEELMSDPNDSDDRALILADIELQDGDILLVPQRSQEVTVIGEVQYPTSHIHTDGLTKDDYIGNSGGLTANADKKRIYVVKANGAVVATPGSKWFGGGIVTNIEAGDTIVVPFDADRVSRLRLVTSVSQIIFQLGVLAAAATR